MARQNPMGIAGWLAVMASIAVVMTIGMLFATGVAQRSLLPRLQARAARAVPAPAPTAAGAAPAVTDAGAQEATGADSLRALRAQLRTEQELLAERTRALESRLTQWQSQRMQEESAIAAQVAALAKVYENMKPEAAARVMVRLDDATFVRVFRKLDRRQAGKILSVLDPERVARLTERLAAVPIDESS